LWNDWRVAIYPVGVPLMTSTGSRTVNVVPGEASAPSITTRKPVRSVPLNSDTNGPVGAGGFAVQPARPPPRPPPSKANSAAQAIRAEEIMRPTIGGRANVVPACHDA
jgi:hypothetical protein